MTVGSFVINQETLIVTLDDREIHTLTPTELELLRYFVDNEGVRITKKKILHDVWGRSPGFFNDRTFMVFMMRLRKLAKIPSNFSLSFERTNEAGEIIPTDVTEIKASDDYYCFTMKPLPALETDAHS